MTDGLDDPGRLDERAAAIIRAGLGRILSSDGFRAAPQLSSFLSFVVERTVEGRASELKGYTIAVEALGRPADFNPQIDPIVRVEAGRLRRALTQYYLGEGQADPVQISMPVGAYVPAFTFSAVAESPAASSPVADEKPEESVDPAKSEATPEGDATAARRWPLAAVAALVAALLSLGAWYLWPAQPPADNASQRLAEPELAARVQPAILHAPQLLRVAITIPTPPADPKLADLLGRFSDLLVDAMARFDDLITIKVLSPGSREVEEVDYVLEMNIQAINRGAEGFGRLRFVRDGRIVWTTSSGRPSVEMLTEADLAEMARRLATRLAEPFGIIPADARQGPPSPASRCILRAFDSRRTMLPDDRVAAQICLEQLVDQDPGFYPAWAHLALLLLGDDGVRVAREDKAKLERALAAALAAIRLAPSGARAYQAMMKVLLARGAAEEAIQMGREALVRNPYDPDIMADLGALFVRRGRPAEGLPLLERAISLSVGRPARYDFYAFLGAYLTGSKKGIETYASTLAADRTPLNLLGQALLAAANDDQPRLSAAIKELGGKAPPFGRDPHGYLLDRGFGEDVAMRLLATLGLPAR
ncbi:tetratricopeptide repeat protein [Bosea sp. BH3]|uniref:tetratricopeptide repeat protein n=1 Tax=Bosea sp. BH3 TaxID=2871701 RepID=UPI0021CB8AD8|nr:hypothetical protein [Bosea sp. BH3]MCU4179150.1 hypothetical protein [Bosea sp. BH3]